jgi:hypothetical protein
MALEMPSTTQAAGSNDGPSHYNFNKTTFIANQQCDRNIYVKENVKTRFE